MDTTIAYSILTYKLTLLVVGFLLAFLGYRLFTLSIWGSAGEFQVKFEKTSLVLKGAAPGTFFAVLGASVIVATIVRGFDLYTRDSSNAPADLSCRCTEAVLGPAKPASPTMPPQGMDRESRGGHTSQP